MNVLSKVISLTIMFVSLMFGATTEADGQRIITGTVTSAETGEPLSGVNVVIPGSGDAEDGLIGTTTDLDGMYELQVHENSTSLLFTYIGFQRIEVSISGRSEINIELQPDVQFLDDIVVVGYGTQRRANLTGALDMISSEQLSYRPAPQTSLLLQGHSPTLMVSLGSRGGEPGARQSLQIRGVGSLSGNTSPLVLVDGVERDIDLIDPETIESITVLKDASASAVYGSRAAFGVILITSKEGQINQPVRGTYSTSFSVNTPYYLPRMHNSLTYADVWNQGRSNTGQNPDFSPEQMDRIRGFIDGTYPHEFDPENPPASTWRGRWDGNANYDWLNMYYKDYSVQQRHNLSVSGGSSNMQYYLSAGLQDQPGIYTWGNDRYQRTNVLARVTSHATDWLRLNFRARYDRMETDRPQGGISQTFLYQHLNILWPTMPRYNPDGTLANPIEVAMRESSRDVTDLNEYQISLGAVIEPISGWVTNINYTYDYRSGKTTGHEYPIPVNNGDGSIGNIGTNHTSYSSTLRTGSYNLFNIYSQFTHQVASHYFSLMGGYEQDVDFNHNLSSKAFDLITNEVPSVSTALGRVELTDQQNHWATQGIFGRFNYNYEEKYLLEVSARYDGSSRFEEGSRWGFFPSASVGYNISSESFWQPIEPYVQQFKLRASYGSLGNQNVSNYLYLNTVPISTNLNRLMDGGRPNYANIPNIRADDLTWETVTTFNVGVELGFLDHRLQVEFDRYERITDNMIGPTQTLPSILGASAPQTNNAKLSTKGFELTVGWRDILGDFAYNMKFGLGDYQTTILEYTNETGNVHSWYAGKKHGDIWGLTTDGLIQSEDEIIPDQSYYHPNWRPGDVKYVDLTGDGKVNPGDQTLDNHGDLSIITNTTPRYQFNFTAVFKWKNLDMNMFWQGIGQRYVIPNAWSEFYWGYTQLPDHGILLQDSHHLNYWRPANETNSLGPNTDAYFARPYFSSETFKNRERSDRWIENAAYIRLKNVQIGYTLPPSVLSVVGIHNARVYISGENLWTYSPLPDAFEPELMVASGNNNYRIYPMQRMFSFGASITF